MTSEEARSINEILEKISENEEFSVALAEELGLFLKHQCEEKNISSLDSIFLCWIVLTVNLLGANESSQDAVEGLQGLVEKMHEALTEVDDKEKE